MRISDSVSVTIVTYNSGRFIKRCLDSVLDQRYPYVEIIVVDNNSTDGTIDILEPFEDRVRIIYNEENSGFAAAQNQAIGASRGEWILTLNPDVLLLPNFIEALVQAGGVDPKVGTVCGKLLTMTSGFDFPEEPVVDSTGIYFTPNLRHLDRGSLHPDNGDYRQYEFVFGATAAAALYRRDMIEDISIDGEFFDNDFFVYREDADVAWRISRAQSSARQPARTAFGNQHAFGEEPVPVAGEEHHVERLQGKLALDYHARSSGDRLLPDPRAKLPEGLLVPGPELEARGGQAPHHHAAPARDGRLHRKLVQFRSGSQAGSQEILRGHSANQGRAPVDGADRACRDTRHSRQLRRV